MNLTHDEFSALAAAIDLSKAGYFENTDDVGNGHLIAYSDASDDAVAKLAAALAALRSGAPARAASQLLGYASEKQDTVLAGVWSFNVAAAGQPVHTVTTKLDERGQFAMMKVQGWLTLNASNPAATMPYSNVDFSATTLTVAEADSLVEQAAALDVKSYALLNQVQAGVTATPPTITTTHEIDQVFAGLTA